MQFGRVKIIKVKNSYKKKVGRKISFVHVLVNMAYMSSFSAFRFSRHLSQFQKDISEHAGCDTLEQSFKS